jgi:SAM-dependent methyltransferase
MISPKEHLAQIAGGNVLDVATGSGQFVEILLEGLSSFEKITGIDTSDKAGEAFKEKFKDHPNVHFMKMDAARIEFPSSSFDTVCISNSLHHMQNLELVLVEMVRVLNPGGHLLISEMYRDNQTETQMTHVLMHHWWGAIDTARGTFHNETYTRQKILDIVTGLGLEQKSILDWSDLSDDPRNTETVKYLTNATEQYLGRLNGLPGEEDLRRRGLELRKRVEEIGFHSATSLLVVAKKG